MKKLGLMMAATVAATMMGAAAHAQTFDWSFTDDQAGDVVSGTISGLNEGVNDTTGSYIVTVTQALDPTTFGSNYVIDPDQGSEGPAQFVVTNGAVTYASMEFDQVGTDTYLYFGTNSECGGSPGNTYCPELVSDAQDQYTTHGADSFKAVSAAPEPGVWALMLAGVAMIGLTLRQGLRQRGMALAA